MVGDELGEKVVEIHFRAAEKLTGAALRKVFGLLLAGGGKIKYHITSNKQSIHKLAQYGNQTQGVEVSKDEMKGFDHYARKYHFEYSMCRKKNDKTQYIFIFKAKDADRLNNAARDWFKDGRDHESIKEKIEQATEKARAYNVNQSHEKEKSKEQTKGRNQDRER
ncbi:hypothetical protein CAFE_23560 [Caprobacter fermentans]|uniref:PcfB family protein n=1 Tax=Caproicibacter fermentans TaxID=2576756 RepID=A0A6N8I0H4_9FIRM|nr:PcfB family protein [Caproicibacter fermentans]MVB11634.1 hypothetical protein [Caproicibacter fermentans]